MDYVVIMQFPCPATITDTQAAATTVAVSLD